MTRSLVIKFMLGITGIVIAVLFISLSWDFRYQQNLADKDLLSKADLVAKQQLATRKLVSEGGEKIHGEMTSSTPEEFGKSVDKLFADMANSQVKQTRLVVRNDQNAPDEFERNALLSFEGNPDAEPVYTRTTNSQGSILFRYVRPLKVEESCLKCHGDPAGALDETGHAKEGMKLGELAGAISVTLPMGETLNERRNESVRLAAGVLTLAAMSLALIWFMLWQQVSVPLEQLAAVAGGVGNNRLLIEPSALAPLQANRETAVVADAFSAMSERLQELYTGLEQKVAERTAQLQQANQELERASKHKSEFLAMVSHDFKTPLTSIITFTELLLDNAAGRINREQKEYLEDVLESSARLQHLVNDLLDLSRLEAGRIKLFSEVIDMRDVARDVERTVRPIAEKKGVTLHCQVPAGLPLVWADPLRITQVLMNLVGNAIKFTPAAGMVTIAAAQSGGEVVVAVRDTGVGIDPEEREAIFEAFRQGGKERPEGSGLGLALARSLVELHGGRLWLESEIGKGSTFCFTLRPWGNEGRVQVDDETDENPGGG